LTQFQLFKFRSNTSIIKSAFRLHNLLITCFTFTLILNINCQTKILQFKNLSEVDGLSSPKVNCSLQDYKGFMWVGTNDGLNRYSGSNFITYRRDPNTPGKIAGNYICTIFQDHSNKLLIGTDGGLSLYDRDLNEFINYDRDSSSALYGEIDIVKKICEDSIGNLWLATRSGLIYFDRFNNQITKYQHKPDDTSSMFFVFILIEQGNCGLLLSKV
jgi:ligand-binding sensor domain-containing protein